MAQEKVWEAMHDETPYEILKLSSAASEEDIKRQYRTLVKQYHPDVCKDLDTDEAEARFIRVQAAYELLTDAERKTEYDKQHKQHPLAANQAFQAYIARRKKAFDQRGDLAAVGWAEQGNLQRNQKLKHFEQQGEEKARRAMVKSNMEFQAKSDNISNKHMLVLKKRELVARKAQQAAQALVTADLVAQMLAEEGFELEDEPEVVKPKMNRRLQG